jgi:hypothetical protein
MADRGEQRLRKRMYKPKQFQKKKRIPPPRTEGSHADNNRECADNNDVQEVHDDDISSSEDSSLEEQTKQIAADVPASSVRAVEQLLQLSNTTSDNIDALSDVVYAHREEEDKATDLDQFLLDVEQPRTSPSSTGKGIHTSHASRPIMRVRCSAPRVTRRGPLGLVGFDRDQEMTLRTLLCVSLIVEFICRCHVNSIIIITASVSIKGADRPHFVASARSTHHNSKYNHLSISAVKWARRRGLYSKSP